MTIKDVETLTGIPRASIRFYEAEGLVCPEREKNGYRVYTQEQVNELLRIRLLRALEIPLEEIRALAAGELAAEDCFSACAFRLEEEQERRGRAAVVCRRLAVECGSYRELNAAYWLSRLEETPALPPAPETNPFPRPAPFRRLLARMVDGSLYLLLCELIQVLAFRANLTQGVTKSVEWWEQMLENWVVLGLLLLFEPLFLWIWGTTPGKWIMGIYVVGDRGERVTYRDAAARSWMLAIYGFGMGIPVVSLFRCFRTAQTLGRGDEPAWEWDTQLRLGDRSRLKPAVLLACCAVLLWGAQTGIGALPEIPPNRGELTVEEFAENFNTMQAYYEGGTNDFIISADLRELTVKVPWALDTSGEWIARDGDFFPWITKGEPPAVRVHTEADGTVSGVTLTFYTEWEAGRDTDTARRGRDFARHIFLMKVTLQAFGGARTENRYPVSGWRTVQDLSANGWRQDYAFALRGIAVDYDVELSGCEPAENGAPKLEETEERCSVSYTFTVRLCQ